jgi:hypothetical protein
MTNISLVGGTCYPLIGSMTVKWKGSNTTKRNKPSSSTPLTLFLLQSSGPIPSFHPFNVLDLQLRINGHYQIKLHKATNYHKGLQIKVLNYSLLVLIITAFWIIWCLTFWIAIMHIWKQLIWLHKCCGILICIYKCDDWIFIWDT